MSLKMNDNTVHLTDFSGETDMETFAAAMAYCRDHPVHIECCENVTLE